MRYLYRFLWISVGLITIFSSVFISGSDMSRTLGFSASAWAQSDLACQVDYVIRNDWGSGATIDVTIYNVGSQDIEGWTLAWSFPGNQQITNGWNATFQQTGADVSATNLSWNRILAAGGSQTIGFNISYSGSNEVPAAFTLNGVLCGSAGDPTPIPTSTPTSQPTVTPTPSPTPTATALPPTPTPTATTLPPTGLGYTVSGNQILDAGGNVIQLRGVNWFGFETGNHVVHGLWARNWQDMMDQMVSLDVNAVRVPVCPGTLDGVSASSIDYSKNPDLQGLDSLALLDRILQGLDARGLYILLDIHTPDCQGISELWYTDSYSESDWIGDLVFMAERYASLPHFLGLDLKNEPHGAATWGTGNVSTDWNLAAERAAAAIIDANPNILVFVEGVADNPVCSGDQNHWWGGNLEPQTCAPLNIPSSRLVLSPHVYGPDVYQQPYFSDPAFPDNMPAIWEAHFGQFADAYPVVIGEWGGKYGHGGDPKDRVWQDALVDYLVDKGMTSTFYWSWNPNSGDTGGILQDDWQTPWADKVDLLHRLWGIDSGNP